MWDLGPGGIAPLGDILLQAGVGVAVPCTIALVIQMVRMKSSPGEEPRHLGVDFGKPVAGIS
jgi:hypothetical protein